MSAPIIPMAIAFDPNGRVYPSPYIGATNARRFMVHAVVEASLSTNTAKLTIMVPCPSPLPSGQCKLRLLLMANATSGAAYVQVSWASLAIGDTPDTHTLNTEGAAAAMNTWAAGDDDELIEYELNLDADTPVAGEYALLEITFGNSASHNLAAVMGLWAMLVWE